MPLPGTYVLAGLSSVFYIDHRNPEYSSGCAACPGAGRTAIESLRVSARTRKLHRVQAGMGRLCTDVEASGIHADSVPRGVSCQYRGPSACTRALSDSLHVRAAWAQQLPHHLRHVGGMRDGEL